jgi:Domain of unknown function DUF11
MRRSLAAARGSAARSDGTRRHGLPELMFSQLIRRANFTAIALCWCATLAGGCASWPGPRIDPSGESLLLWPNQSAQVPVVAAPAGSPFVAPPPALVAPPFGNLQAPPVYPDVPAVPMAPPVITVPAPLPATGPTATTVPYGAAPVVPAPVIPAMPVPAVAAVTHGVATPLGAAVPVGQDYMRVTPDRVLAPVGSEVVLKAGICGADGYLVANQRIEWLLTPGGAGQFVDLGDREQLQLLRSPWDTPRKVDNTYAIGSTAAAPVCLYRGTPDPADDVQILRGDAWVTVTSAAEGVSHVTAYTPAIQDWNLRRAIATIYWIDAQWSLPPSTAVPAGRPHVLTATVLRRTNGAPLAGWLVRYEAASGALLGYGGGNVVEVPTDAAGRASVEVSPADMGGGSTTVNITIIRPPGAADGTPRLEIGRGLATLSWTGGVTEDPIGPAPTGPAPISPGTSPPIMATPLPSRTSPYEATPQPTLPSSEPPPSGSYTPPADERRGGRPRLEVSLQRTTPEQVAVGDFASFQAVVRNVGDGTARSIRIRDRFDRGLSHSAAKPNEFAVEYPNMRALAPGESETITLTFQVTAGGTQCHELTVTAEGADAVSERGCVTARQAALEVAVTGPRSRIAGETAEFSAVVRNVGDVAATNVEVVVRFDRPLEASRAEPGHERLPDGALVMRVERMEAGERRTFRMEAVCRSAANSACNKVVVTAEGSVTAAAEACVEILPLLPQGGPGAGAAAAAAMSLRLAVTESTNPGRVGERQVVYVTLRNNGQQVERQISVRVLLPPELTADAAQIQPQDEASVRGQEIRFTVIPDLQPQVERQYVIPVTPSRAGNVRIRAELTAAGLATPIVVESNPIEILPR